MKGVFFLAVCVLAAACLSAPSVSKAAAPLLQSERPDTDSFQRRAEKLVFAISMQNFPLHRNLSHPIDFDDRPLYWDPHMSPMEADRLKARLMEDAGIDVNAQTVFYADGRPEPGGDTSRGFNILDRRLEAFSETSVLIAPEIVGVSRSMTHGYGADDLAGFFEKLITRFGTHPGIFRHDGRMVVFLWNPLDYRNLGRPGHFGVDEMAEVWDKLGGLRDEIYVINESYYLVGQQDFDERWDREDIRRELTVCDNLFYWYSESNPERDRLRTSLLADSVRYLTEEDPVIASVRPGYWRKNTGGTNPFNATRKLRQLWEASVSADPDWIYLYSWDDYSEHGMFEPTRANRGMYSALARALTKQWKGEDVSTSVGRLWIGTPRTLMRGMPLYIEVVLIEHEKAVPAEIRVGFEDQDGEKVHVLGPAEPISEGGVHVYPFSLDSSSAGLDGRAALTPVVYEVPEAGKTLEHRGIPPVRILEHHPGTPLYRFTLMDELRKPDNLEFSFEQVSGAACAHEAAGEFLIESGRDELRRVELRTMDDKVLPFESERAPGPFSDDAGPFDHFYLPLEPCDGNGGIIRGKFSIDSRYTGDALSMLYLFIEYADGSTYSSRPLMRKHLHEDAGFSSTVFDLEEALETGDIEWSPIGSVELVADRAVIADWHMDEVAEASIRHIRTINPALAEDVDMDEVAGDGSLHPFIPDRSCYGHPLYSGYGPSTRRYRGTSRDHPSLYEGEHIAGLEFDGVDDVARLPERMFPPGSGRIEMRFMFRELPQEPQWLFWAKNELAGLMLLPCGNLVYGRSGREVRTTQPLAPGEVHEITAGTASGLEGAGEGELVLYIGVNGSASAVKHLDRPLEIGYYSSFWNDLILLGGSLQGGFFKGVIGRTRILNAVPVEQPFAVFAE